MDKALQMLGDAEEQDLGTIVAVLDGREMYEAADALASGLLTYEFKGEWGDGMEALPVIAVPPGMIPLITPEVLRIVDETTGATHNSWYLSIGESFVRPLPADPDWRERRKQAKDNPGVNNQGSPGARIQELQDRFKFGSGEELAVYLALKRKQQSLPPESTIGIIPGSGYRVRERTVWPDFVVTYRGLALGIEVDGPHHYGRAAADHSRDQQLKDAGLRDVERIVVEDIADQALLDLSVERWLNRLLGR